MDTVRGVTWEGQRRYVLSRDHPTGHRAVWEYLLDRRKPYPTGLNVDPWKRPQKADQWHQYAVLRMTAEEGDRWEEPQPVQLDYHSGHGSWSVDLTRHDVANDLASRLFCHRHRGYHLVFLHGARFAFQLILRFYAHSWAALGYDIEILGTGTEVRALIVTKGRHCWRLTDASGMTGISDASIETRLQAEGYHYDGPQTLLPALFRWIEHLQSVCLTYLDTALGTTAASTGLRAAGRHLPADLWLWRPSPLLVSLARQGGGLRGAYKRGGPHRGTLHKLDVRRLYTSVLSGELPGRMAFGDGGGASEHRPGIYLSTVKGPGTYPIYLDVWHEETRTFTRGAWQGRECIATVPTWEYPGLAALGYSVEPAWGFAAQQTFRLDGYVNALQRILDDLGPDSSAGQASKLWGDGVWGKWAMPRNRTVIRYSAGIPGPEWYPFLTEDGNAVRGMWCKKADDPTGTQQVALAAAVTSGSRSVLYQQVAAVQWAGGTVTGVDTDAVFTDLDPRGVLPLDPATIGAWRLVASDADAVFLRPGAYALGTDIKHGGSPVRDRQILEALHRGETWTVAGKELRPPWEGGATFQTIERALRPSS